MGLLQTWACRPKSLTRKSQELPRTLRRPWWQQIWNLSLQTQTLSSLPGEGASGPAELGFCPPAALTLPPLLPLPAHPFPPSAPDSQDLFKLCCKCNKPDPVPH